MPARRKAAVPRENEAATTADESQELVSNSVLLTSRQPIVAVRPALLPVPLAAQVLGLGRTTVFELLRLGELKAVRVGKRRLIAMQEIEEFVARLRLLEEV